jgi:hypothetical protein
MLLSNLHPLRTKNIVRSHMMEVEVWERPVERVLCFLSACLFPPSYLLV